MSDEKFDKWNEVKKKTDNTKREFGFKQREIWWVRIGQNIGYEQYGKGNEFQRPVLVIRKLTHNLFIGIPLTSTIRDNNDYFHKILFTTKDGRVENTAMILQLKTFDKKRLMGKVATLNKNEYNEIIKKVKGLFIPS